MSTHYFPVRHLSPAAAHALVRLLDALQPDAVLVEGPSDCNDMIASLTHAITQPPIAMLAYTTTRPVHSLMVPLAVYSPELQAMRWAVAHAVHAEWIDLPAAVTLAMDAQRAREQREAAQRRAEEADESKATCACPPEAEEDEADDESVWSLDEARTLTISGELSMESFWERTLEQSGDAWIEAATAWGVEQRAQEAKRPDMPLHCLRESYMRRKIREAEAEHKTIVVVTGAFHTPVLADAEAMTDAQWKALPRIETEHTLMPYTYRRMTARSGYGAGNDAPAYFELMWHKLRAGKEDLDAEYLARLAGAMRRTGNWASSASVIEAVRMARAWALLRGGRPVLQELHSAATACLGGGEFGAIAAGVAEVDIGQHIGILPEGVCQAAIQRDFARELSRLKLERFRTPVPAELVLDLRENRRVKSEEAAFLDLSRSFFLHQLEQLGIGFAALRARPQDWQERWMLGWTPESEIALVEAGLLGETVDVAARERILERLAETTEPGSAAQLVREACEAGLSDIADSACVVLQRVTVNAASVEDTAHAARELSTIIRFGNLRRYDAAPLVPLLAQLFLRAVLLLDSAADCDDDVAGAAQTGANVELSGVARAMCTLHELTQVHEGLAEAELDRVLRMLAGRTDRNALLCGLAATLLLERGQLDDDGLAGWMQYWLSPGMEARHGARWIEGLLARNRSALIARLQIWRSLDAYLGDMDEAQFRRALVFLRRALGGFTPAQKRSISENLGEIWGREKGEASAVIAYALTSEETQVLEALDEFDFGDL